MLLAHRSASAVVVCSLLVSSLAHSQSKPKIGMAVCTAGPLVGRSPSGLVQVSNLDLIDVSCKVRARSLTPTSLGSLTAAAKVFEIAGDGTKRAVPSNVRVSGDGQNLDMEYVNFYVDVPIDVGERDAAIRAWMARVVRAAEQSGDPNERNQAQLVQKISPSTFAATFRQHRVGRFQAECQVLDGAKALAHGRVDFEVIFKGNFFDQPQFKAAKQ